MVVELTVVLSINGAPRVLFDRLRDLRPYQFEFIGALRL